MSKPENTKPAENPFGTVVAVTADLPKTKRVHSYDAALADSLYAVASANKNGVSNGVTYASVEDEAYKRATKVGRYALAQRVSESERATVVVIPVDGGVQFALVIKPKGKPRGPRKAKETATA